MLSIIQKFMKHTKNNGDPRNTVFVKCEEKKMIIWIDAEKVINKN